jgi:hypothetical protein
MMKKLLEKKKSKGMLSDEESSAKMSVLKNLRGKSNESLAEKLKGAKKVSVMSDSEEGLKAGLDKAKEIVESEPSELDSPDQEMEKMTGDDEDSEDPYCEMSEDQLDEHLAKLMAKKEELKASKEQA